MAGLSLATRGTLVAAASAASVAPLWLVPGQVAAGVAGAMHAVALVVALVIMVRAARSGDPAMRRPRWFFSGALAAPALGGMLSVGYLTVAGALPIPSLADVAVLGLPLGAFGFWMVPSRPGANAGKRRLFADAAVAATATLFISWVLVLQPLADSGRYSALGQAIQLAYPISDVFVAALVLSLLPRARGDLRPFLNCVAAGLLLVTLSDSGATLRLAHSGVASFGWPDLTLQAGIALLALAGTLRPRPAQQLTTVTAGLDRNLPYLPVTAAIGVGIWHLVVIGPMHHADALLAIAMLLATVGRQMAYTNELATAAAGYRYAAVHDELTGLANRKAFFARLSEHLATPGSGAAAVLLLDLDGFKEINDTFGHHAGDEVLVGYAQRLRAAAPGDLVARLGGDEFAIFLVDPAATAQGGTNVEFTATSLASRLVAAATATSKGRLDVACSIGIAVLRPGDDPAQAVRRADLAMYAAKRSPASQLEVFRDEMADEANREHLLMAALAGAVDRGEMRLVYQPLYRLNDGTLAGAEALLRWTSPLLGVVPPDEFIPLAENSGDIGSIGQWVLEQSVRQMARWQRQEYYLPRLFVNVSATQFTEELPVQVASVLASTGVPAERLTLEITEGQLPSLGVNRPMQLLRESGVTIALDDFGTGYSSLAQLARLPVDIVKIDRDFITNLGETAGRPVLDAVIQLAKALGLTTVAEGIEDIGQAAEASNAGIDIAQGYLFSHPLTAEEFGRRLSRIPSPVSGGEPLPGRARG